MKKQFLAIGFAVLSLVIICVLWFLLLPPEYIKKNKGGDSFFDTLKGEFSNIDFRQ